MIREQPWLGIGWGAYPYVYPYYDFFVQNEAVTIYHAHNTLLNLAAEVGIPGMLCFAIAWGMALWKMLQSVMKVKKRGKGFRLGMLLAIAGLAAFSITDHVLFNMQMMAIFLGLLAVTASLPEDRSNKVPQFWLNKKFVGLAGIFSLRANR
jgi:putative inorganic carbon (HCO3(-)) transporter